MRLLNVSKLHVKRSCDVSNLYWCIMKYAVFISVSIANMFLALLSISWRRLQAGLILGLFGGTSRNSEVATRCDPHVLVVGDPGLGKSQVRITIDAWTIRENFHFVQQALVFLNLSFIRTRRL